MPYARQSIHKLTIDTFTASESRSKSTGENPQHLSEQLSNPPNSRGWSSIRSDNFLEDRTVIDPDMPERDRPSSIVLPRDSHDLSLSPRNVTRDSFVTNMLLSLDQFSIAQTNSNQGFDSFEYPQENTQYPGSWASVVGETTAREHQQGSYGSDVDGARDYTRLSGSVPRERRSESNPYTMNSTREKGRGNASPWTTHARGGKISKNSSTASIDTPCASPSSGTQNPGHEPTQPQSSRMPLQPPPSLTQTQKSPMSTSPQNGWHQQNDPMSPFQIDFGSGFSEDFDAAPTPTVYSGPRRTPSTPSMAQPTVQESNSSRTLDLRKRSSSSRSLKSSAIRKAASARETVPAVPLVPTFDTDSAPAPNVGYGKTKEGTPTGSPAGKIATAPREKQGFFRKIFGGSSKASNDAAEPPVNYRLPSGSDMAEHTGSRGNPAGSGSQTTLAKSGSVPSTRDTSSSHSHNPPALQKKPSSFFRRRRKSVNDEQPPPPEDAPPVPQVDPALKAGVSPLPSPATLKSGPQKLRKASGPPSTPTRQARPMGNAVSATPDWSDTNEAAGEYMREFSPDYEPSPNARIRTVQSETRDLSQSPASVMKRPEISAVQNDSFLDLDVDTDEDDLHLTMKGKVNSSNKKTGRQGVDRDPATPATKKGNTARIDAKEEVANSSTASGAATGTKMSGKTPQSNPSTPTVKVEEAAEANEQTLEALDPTKSETLDEPAFVVGEPTEDDRIKAKKIYDGSEEFIQQERAAAWMGEEGPVRQRTLYAYMELYDFTACSVLSSLRQICDRLILRAETQQVDRLLLAFSKRWVRCNPNHGFKATDVIHTICYSIILLNTDLHLADIERKMTRSQFVKNTITTIMQTILDSAPEAFDRRPSVLSEKSNTYGPDEPKSTVQEERKAFRNSFRPPPRADSGSGTIGNLNDCGPLVKSPFHGTLKLWEELIESVLKSIYNSIRDERLPLFGSDSDRDKNVSTAPSQSSLSVGGILRRTPSVLSKAPSEVHGSSRGRINEVARPTASRWSSKSRSRPGVNRNGFTSSHTSFDDGGSLWSPALSSSATWSRQSLGRTQTSGSQDSVGSAMPRGDYQQSIGFANALSQAIIRDEDANSNDMTASTLGPDDSTNQLLEDESLELSGPPWMKEGMVVHKHHLDGVDKKAKERNWSEVFAVVQKGQMSLFSFTASKPARQKSRSRDPYRTTVPVGGGNWQDNATAVGHFSLRQTLASALPPPGYSRSRPHVWALSLPNGAIHLFQVGTPELIKEFVNTVNYWSARLSTHPLVGGVSNMEYGWSDAIVNKALIGAMNEPTTASISSYKGHRPSSSLGRRSSLTSGSFRGSSLDQGLGSLTMTSSRGKLPGDRIHIADWTPPTQSMRQSSMTEMKQLSTLKAYVRGVEEELQAHNQLRSPMLLEFTTRGANAVKAMSNWERKSAYLLREIVKFRTYVDCLQAAETRKKDVYAERDLAQKAARGELSDDDMDVSEGEEGDETLRP